MKGPPQSRRVHRLDDCCWGWGCPTMLLPLQHRCRPPSSREAPQPLPLRQRMGKERRCCSHSARVRARWQGGKERPGNYYGKGRERRAQCRQGAARLLLAARRCWPSMAQKTSTSPSTLPGRPPPLMRAAFDQQSVLWPFVVVAPKAAGLVAGTSPRRQRTVQGKIVAGMTGAGVVAAAAVETDAPPSGPPSSQAAAGRLHTQRCRAAAQKKGRRRKEKEEEGAEREAVECPPWVGA